MSDRERWIVYPLLFLALGAALRDKLVDRTTTKSIACQELRIVDEHPLGREPVLLARLGSIPRSKADDPYSAQLVLNGQIEVVDRLSLNQPLNPLITIGRARIGPRGVVGGHIDVHGQVSVDGAINATIYAWQGQPIVPVLRGFIPGASLPAELLRAAPHALVPKQAPPASEPSQPATPPSPAPPSAPADSTDSGDAPDAVAPSPTSPAVETPPADQPDAVPPPTAPLADPAETR
jgi:hypothetical protein